MSEDRVGGARSPARPSVTCKRLALRQLRTKTERKGNWREGGWDEAPKGDYDELTQAQDAEQGVGAAPGARLPGAALTRYG